MDAPFRSSPLEVKPEWIDYNGHLNMAYYNVLFDTGVDQLWEVLGFGPDYRATRGMTTFIAEFHIRYLREVHEGDRLTVTYQLLDHTEKSFHFYQEILHPDGWVSASGEGLGLHIDMSGPRVAAMPEDILTNFRALKAAHAALPIPATVGKPIGLKR